MKKSLGEYQYYSLPDLLGSHSKMPISVRIMLESLMRNCDGKKVREEDIQRLAKYNAKKPDPKDVPFCVARLSRPPLIERRFDGKRAIRMDPHRFRILSGRLFVAAERNRG